MAASCGKPARTGGLCYAHSERGLCSVADCNRGAIALGLCYMHGANQASAASPQHPSTAASSLGSPASPQHYSPTASSPGSPASSTASSSGSPASSEGQGQRGQEAEAHLSSAESSTAESSEGESINDPEGWLLLDEAGQLFRDRGFATDGSLTGDDSPPSDSQGEASEGGGVPPYEGQQDEAPVEEEAQSRNRRGVIRETPAYRSLLTDFFAASAPLGPEGGCHGCTGNATVWCDTCQQRLCHVKFPFGGL